MTKISSDRSAVGSNLKTYEVDSKDPCGFSEEK